MKLKYSAYRSVGNGLSIVSSNDAMSPACTGSARWPRIVSPDRLRCVWYMLTSAMLTMVNVSR